MINIPAETKTITTPNGNTVELKGYLSGRDQREFRKVLVSMDDLSKADSLENVENVVLKTCVISLDNDPENLLERILDLPSADYSFILAQANESIQGFNEEKKTTLNGSTSTGSEESQ